MLEWVLLAVVGVATLLYWYLTHNNNYWKSKGVYTAPGALPGVGHLWDAFRLKKSARLVHCEIYHQTKGHPAVGIYSFREPMLLLRDPALVQKVLISDFSSFHDNSISVDEKTEPYLSKNPFLLKGQKWKAMRQLLAPALTPARIKAMFPLIRSVCEDFNNYMDKHLNEDVNVQKVAGLFTSDAVAKCAFGLDGHAFTDPNAEFYNQGQKLWSGSFYNPLMMLLFTYFPIFNKLFKKSLFNKEVVDFFISIIRQTKDYRERNPDKAPDDYIQFLINLHNKKEGFTFDDIIGQSSTFYTDGYETSSITSSFALYELTVNPDLQEAVREEVQGMDAFTFENINSLPILDRVLQETLRKYSVLSFSKKCTNDFILQAGGKSFPVREGEIVIIPVYGLHHDPDIYPDPEKFDPDRFLPENVKQRHPATHLGFGGGPRICIGNRFATCQIKILIANILANFRLVRCGKTVDQMRLSPQHTVPVAEKGVWAQFQRL
ncbi:cytochrome P450 6k1-like [Homalodisca vitripennis]|uniref:cytochrome P450 6k1-like n=1 Tax=Homalodisca vitripennis TaxID=197043 RepID=UPI001EEBC973|nr:cytochrome P450 6k1-like [Homalodisca vitripennis]